MFRTRKLFLCHYRTALQICNMLVIATGNHMSSYVWRQFHSFLGDFIMRFKSNFVLSEFNGALFWVEKNFQGLDYHVTLHCLRIKYFLLHTQLIDRSCRTHDFLHKTNAPVSWVVHFIGNFSVVDSWRENNEYAELLWFSCTVVACRLFWHQE